MNPDIVFPNLDLQFEHINPIAFTIFNIPIYWYAIFIVSGVISGLYLARYRAKKNGEDPEIYSDFLVYALIAAIIGARVYYVAFSFDDYKDNLMDIFAFREGGLAIYGGVIGAVLALFIYSKKKKLSFWQMADTAAPGLALGQVLGRMGNFMNMEAFGGPTNSLFAMGLKAEKAKIPSSMISYIAPIEGYTENYLLVQPTFAYEALWNVLVIILLSLYTKHKKFEGEIFVGYLLLYGIGRGIIEGLRTDQLLILNTNIPISQVLAWVMVLGSLMYIFYKRKKIGN